MDHAATTTQASRRNPPLSRLRDLPRPEAIRIAVIKYGWDATTAAKRVDIERDKPSRER